MSKKAQLTTVIVLFGVLLATFYAGRITKKCETPEIRVDTVVRVDTVKQPIPEYEIRYIVRTDSIPYYVYDHTKDTVVKYIQIPIERKEYRTSEYFAVVEGYKPKLQHIETYSKTVYVDRVERYKEKTRWGVGVQVGTGYGFDGKFTPYVGIGVQYNIFVW